MALSDADLKRLSLQAKIEIGETNVAEKLENLKNVLQTNYENLTLPPDFDGFLIRSLRVRKFDVARTAKLISQYFKLNSDIADMHCFLLPSLHADLYAALGVAILKHRDSQGRAIVCCRQDVVSPEIYPFDKSLAGTVLLLDECLRSSVDTQRLGVVFLVDFKGYSLAHFRQASPTRLRTAAKLFQDAFPARFKGFHFVRNPFLVSCMYAIVKPFVREKIKNRVFFHGYDFESLHKSISPDILPEFLGGKLANDAYADEELMGRLLQQDSYYLALHQHGYRR